MAPSTQNTSNVGVDDNISGVNISGVNPSSPLYLLPSDSPGTILVTTTFNGTGYGSWRRGMLLGLSCKNKLGLINGSIRKPSTTDPLFQAWNRCNDMVVAWILNSLDKEIRETVMYTESAEKLWKEVERRFGQASGTKIFQIRKEISSISQGSSSVASYFNRIKKLWDELSFSLTYPDCVCGCKDGFLKLEEEQRVHQFLMGLNDSYSTTRRNILMLKPLPDIDSVYSMLIDDESQSELRANIPSFNSDSVAFSTGNQKPYNQKITFDPSTSKRTTMICRYCKKPGHQIDKCYKLNGYPSTPGQSRVRRTAALAQASESESMADPISTSCSATQPNSSITKEQFEQLLNLLQQYKLTSPKEITAGSANFAGYVGKSKAAVSQAHA